ncbi:oxidoreductase [Corynebacterium kutscheri]|uniref:oxidoreductase n=1 Tax=Corynebacterium kutscheri TaxID=35755 RepID=UPI0037BF86CA
MFNHARVIAEISSRREEFFAMVASHFYADVPLARLSFRLQPSLVDTLIAGLSHPLNITAWAHDLAHRGVDRSFYVPLSAALQHAVCHICSALPLVDVLAVEHRIDQIMKQLLAVNVDTLSAPIPAEVVEIERRSSRITVVRLIAEAPLSYKPGEYLQVTTDYFTGIWRCLYPSVPANEHGQVEFHLFHTNLTTPIGLLASARIGEKWLLANGYGKLSLSGNDLVMISHNTGLAPLRCIIIDYLMRTNAPRVHLFVGADSPGELYELQSLWGIAASAPWLSVTPVVGTILDPWWVRPTQACVAPRGLHLTQLGDPADVVASYGTWEDRDILISGDKQRVDYSSRTLIRAGTPIKNISSLHFNHIPAWMTD